MQNISFQVFAWVASAAYAIEVVGTKFLSKYKIKNPWLLNFFFSLLVLIFTVPLALHYGIQIPIHWTNIFWCGVLFGLANIFYILALL